jgi:formylglycine-generating enzyme
MPAFRAGLCTLLALADAPASAACPAPEAGGDGPTAGMAWVAGGGFTMGDDDAQPEERPAHRVTVSGFWIDRHEVTNAEFAAFVAATGYVTMNERGADPARYPDMPPDLLVPGGMVFAAPDSVAERADVTQWWRYVPGANWRQPLGPGSTITGREAHPVVQIAQEDARAYAAWRGRALPTEAQWEFAARGGLDGAAYSWGETYFEPAQGWRVNSWQGSFPLQDTGEDGFHGTAPVGCFPANGYGLHDMAGNVWEYTADWFLPEHGLAAASDPAGQPEALAAGFGGPVGPMAVIKGGSWLCAPDFCARYRPSGRQPQELGLGSNHIGFRTVLTAPPPG